MMTTIVLMDQFGKNVYTLVVYSRESQSTKTVRYKFLDWDAEGITIVPTSRASWEYLLVGLRRDTFVALFTKRKKEVLTSGVVETIKTAGNAVEIKFAKEPDRDFGEYILEGR